MSTATDRRLDIGMDELERRIVAMRSTADRTGGLTADLMHAHADDLASTLDYMREIYR